MVAQSIDQSTVRALVALTGGRYQQCLNAVRVLQPLVGRLDLGDLAPLLTGSTGPRYLGIRVDIADLDLMRAVLDRFPAAVGQGHVLDRGANETRLIVPLSASFYVAGHTLVLDSALEGSLWPMGVWAFDAREFQDALRAPVQIDDPAARPSVLVRATPAECPSAPPDDPGGGVAAADAVLAAPPTSVEGDSFGWASYDLSSVGAAILVLPTLLSAAARELLSVREPDDDSAQVYMPAPPSGHEWYGIDISDGARLWCAAPSRHVGQQSEATA